MPPRLQPTTRGQTRATKPTAPSRARRTRSAAESILPELRPGLGRSARTRAPRVTKTVSHLKDPRRRADVRSRGSAPAPARRSRRRRARLLAAASSQRSRATGTTRRARFSCDPRTRETVDAYPSSPRTAARRRRTGPSRRGSGSAGPAAGLAWLPRGRGPPRRARQPQDPWAMGQSGDARRQRRGGGHGCAAVASS